MLKVILYIFPAFHEETSQNSFQLWQGLCLGEAVVTDAGIFYHFEEFPCIYEAHWSRSEVEPTLFDKNAVMSRLSSWRGTWW